MFDDRGRLNGFECERPGRRGFDACCARETAVTRRRADFQEQRRHMSISIAYRVAFLDWSAMLIDFFGTRMWLGPSGQEQGISPSF
jgi:hypothetical protein